MTAPSLPTLRGARVVLRPLAEDDLDALVGHVTAPGVREWWGAPLELDETREELRNDGSAFAIEVDGALAGWLGICEELSPNYRSAGIDIMLAPPFQDRGLGSEALRLAARWLFEQRGHHRLTIDPAAANARAIRAYERVGFRPVGRMRRYERVAPGEWRDSLLMDMLAGELR